MSPFQVVAAIIIYEEKILCVQRGIGKYDYISLKYEFPGGKVEIGETNEQAIIREIKEELNLEINIQNKFIDVDYEYPDFRVTIRSFICSCEDPSITLNEHLDYKWLDVSELNSLNWTDADVAIIEAYQNLLEK